MTEDEAKTKWCPHVRVLSDEGSMVIATVNRGSGLQADINCIASDCMMWVWETSPREAEDFNNFTINSDQDSELRLIPSGHCELAK